MALAMIVVVGVVWRRNNLNKEMTVLEGEQVVENSPTPVPIPEPEDLSKLMELNVLLLGYGGAGHQGGYLTDVVMLVHFDLEKKVVAMISIPRDLWVELPGGKQGGQKINEVFTEITTAKEEYPTADLGEENAGIGANLAKLAVEKVTGLTPYYFVAIDFNGFARAIDELGGVTVGVPHAFTDEYYPVRGRELELCGMSPEEIEEVHEKYSGFELEKQFECRYETLSFEEEETEMDGELALKFVRSRHSLESGSDFKRSERQMALLKGIMDKVLSFEAIEDKIDFFREMSQSLHTDINEKIVVGAWEILQDVGDYRTVQVNLSTENVLRNGKSSSGQFILLPQGGMEQWNEVRAFVKNGVTMLND